MTLEDMLREMECYGRPRVGKYGDTWACSLEMFVSGAGVHFEVKSDYDHKTASDAATVCLDRMRDVLRKIQTGARTVAALRA